MKMKNLSTIALIGILSFSPINVFAFTDAEQENLPIVTVGQSDAIRADIEQKVLVTNKPIERLTNQVINESLSGSRGSATYAFSVSSSQLHYRVYINNTSNASYTVTVGGNTFTVSAGTSQTKVYSASNSGTRYIDITSRDGSALKGNIAVRISSTLAELQ